MFGKCPLIQCLRLRVQKCARQSHQIPFDSAPKFQDSESMVNRVRFTPAALVALWQINRRVSLAMIVSNT